MTYRRLFPCSLALLLLCQAVWAGVRPTPTRVLNVFPFEIGQQYEFQSGTEFLRPNGDVLAPHSVATITITEVTIYSQVYLHIPYWSMFGSEYYRLDDSLLVRQYHSDIGRESVLMDLNIPSLEVPLPLRAQQGMAYVGTYSQSDKIFYRVREYYRDIGWRVLEGDTAWVSEFGIPCADPIQEVHGVGSDRVTYHGVNLFSDDPVIAGVFRSVSSDPWPNLQSQIIISVSPTKWDQIKHLYR